VKHKIEFRPGAVADIDNIYSWIAKDSPVNAFKFIQRIHRRCEKLADFPEIGPLHEDLRPGLRLLPFERRIVIAYTVKEGVVSIGRIFYGRRDIRALIGNMDD